MGEGWRNQLTCERNCALPGNRRRFNIPRFIRRVAKYDFAVKFSDRVKNETKGGGDHLPPLSNIRARSIGSTLLIASFRSNEARYESGILSSFWLADPRFHGCNVRRDVEEGAVTGFSSNAPRFRRNSYGGFR